MPSTVRACHSCQTPIPHAANYCPTCGAATPTAISRETGEVIGQRVPDADEADYRQRLQRALGQSYELGQLLGRGGFAEVYRARDLRLKRDVAVKTLRYDLHAAPTIVARFQREAEAMAQLSHPHIMPIYSVGGVEEIAFFIMPLARGATLREVLAQETRLTLADARRIVLETASALHHAHQAGIVHRDIKPDNIILEGEERRVLVMDFGIAKAAEADDGDLTGTGVIIGTPHYMSPEQASGERAIDHRADLYSLGVVAFQMITGELPFSAATVHGLIMKHITEEAPPVDRLRPECPGILAAAIARCLAKEPGSRWESAAALSAALEPGEGRAVAAELPTLFAGAVATPKATLAPVQRFRRALFIYIAANAALLTIDLAVDRAMDFAPVIAALWAFALASQYARLWMDGYDLRDIVFVRSPAKRRGLGTGEVSGSELKVATGDSGHFGAHAPVVNRVRSERAVIVGLVERMPRVEREKVADVVPAADRVLARVRSLARQLQRLDRVVAQIEGKAETASAGGAATLRDREVVQDAVVKRNAIVEETGSCEVAIQQLRVALERAVATGVAEARTDLEVAVDTANARARGGC